MVQASNFSEFDSDGISIRYLDVGEGDPILLIHGFASNIDANWVATSWVTTLTEAGRRVIALDNRGHGQSEKLYEPERYGAPAMAEDAVRLMDHLGIERADVMGYSMGARIAAFLTFAHPDRVRSLVFGGLGSTMVRGMIGAGPLAHALEAPSIDDVTNATARSFRRFAESTKSDLKALAACMRGPREKVQPEALGEISVPTLVVVGSEDVIGGSPAELAALIPNSQYLELKGRDHMKAVGDQEFKRAVLDFLRERR
ncbi:alpha/beta fold hydrolase [Methyloligella halotolerans]|uniref:alpha/beta fold hydrolase n=1 Tax=Methyloligella halotolerans TaxID=1177755 RepID=UPI001FDA1F25|nr:alpha/beta fold hydrolase [Methyloligella halotolerans]